MPSTTDLQHNTSEHKSYLNNLSGANANASSTSRNLATSSYRDEFDKFSKSYNYLNDQDLDDWKNDCKKKNFSSDSSRNFNKKISDLTKFSDNELFSPELKTDYKFSFRNTGNLYREDNYKLDKNSLDLSDSKLDDCSNLKNKNKLKKFTNKKYNSDDDYLDLYDTKKDLNEYNLNKKSKTKLDLFNNNNKSSELRKLEFRKSSDLRRSIDLKDSLDLLDEPILSTYDKDNIKRDYKNEYNKYGGDSLTKNYNLDDLKSDYKLNSKFLDLNTKDYIFNDEKRNLDNKKTNYLSRKSTLSDHILDEIRKYQLKEEIRNNEIMNELKNAENVLKHQDKYLFKTESLDGGKAASKKNKAFSLKELNNLMEKLEQDNKLLAELDQKVKTANPTSNKSSIINSSLLNQLHSSLPSLNKTTNTNNNNLYSSSYSNNKSLLDSTTGLSLLPRSTNLPYSSSRNQSTINNANVSNGAITSVLNTVVEQQKQLQQQIQQQQLNLNSVLANTSRNDTNIDIKLAEDVVDSIEIANRGRFRVFIARYSYDPFKQSPNEHPEAELVLNAGDFLLIQGDMDEDGFYHAENLDGRKGLVPCNFVEKLTGEDLFEFQANILYGHKTDSLLDDNESVQLNILGTSSDLPSSRLCSATDGSTFPSEFYDALLTDAMQHTNFQHLLAPEDFHRMNDYVDLAESHDIDEEDLSDVERAQAIAARDPVAPPKRLILERQLHKSILIGWLHPDCPRGLIDCYHIYVDGVHKATVPSGERTKALVEGVDSSIPHRISIRAVTSQGNMSRDAACTIIIGKSVPFAPCCVKATNITSESALISWLPCNSNFYHVVAVNSVEVKTVPPTHYKYLIAGLTANTLYRVSVRAKPGKLLSTDVKNPKKMDMLTTYVDFKTLPKSLPEPPVDVQVETGPQEGALLVTWLPVTLDQFGTSNGCPVTGYAVFASHKKLAEIDSPTGDHALLDVNQLENFHKKLITVRTKSGENLSQDSMPCQIPEDLLKFTAYRKGVGRTHFTTKHHSCNSIHHSQHHLYPNSTQVSNQMTHPSMSSHQAHQNLMQQQQNQEMYAPDGTLIDPSNRMQIPAIEITKDTPSDSMNLQGTYSEEEYHMRNNARKNRFGLIGNSPQPPQRHHFIGRNAVLAGRQHQQQMHQHMQQNYRWFVALYDYDPMTMSPNPDAADEELPFREGDLIKVFGEKDADGFYRGEINGRHGFVPCNMVSELQYDPETGHPTNSLKQQQYTALSAQDPWSHLPVRRMVALYDYDPLQLSPNPDAEMELAFNIGDIIYVYGEMDDDGFFMGEVNGIRGLVPSNFLSDAPADVKHRGRHGNYIHPNSARNLRQQNLTQQQLMNNMRQRPTSLDLNIPGGPRYGIQPNLQNTQQNMQMQPVHQNMVQPNQQQQMMGHMQPNQQPQPMQPQQIQPAPQQSQQQQTSFISGLFGGKKENTVPQTSMINNNQPMQQQSNQNLINTNNQMNTTYGQQMMNQTGMNMQTIQQQIPGQQTHAQSQQVMSIGQQPGQHLTNTQMGTAHLGATNMNTHMVQQPQQQQQKLGMHQPIANLNQPLQQQPNLHLAHGNQGQTQSHVMSNQANLQQPQRYSAMQTTANVTTAPIQQTQNTHAYGTQVNSMAGYAQQTQMTGYAQHNPYGQQNQFNQQQHQPGPGATISGALGAVKSIFKI